MHDCVIVGGGPAGLTAGLYIARFGLDCLLLERGYPGGQMILTHLVENYPGFPKGISGQELSEAMKEQAVRFGVEIVQGEVWRIAKGSDSFFEVETSDNKKYEGLSIVVATGTEPSKLHVPGEERLFGKGVSYCAVCDGPLYKGKDVVVVGGGDAAVEEALFLTRFAGKVTIVHRRGRLRATHCIQEKALQSGKIDLCLNSVVIDIIGGERVEAVRAKNLIDNAEQEIPCSGVFIYVGKRPNTTFLQGLVETDNAGYIITNNEMETSMEGVYACGDVRKKALQQIVVACGEGAVAARSAQRYVEDLKGSAY